MDQNRTELTPRWIHILSFPGVPAPPMQSYLGHKTLGAATAPAAEPSLGAASTAATAAAAPVVALAVARPPRGCPASIPARVIRLTTEGLEVWSVAKGDGNGGGGTESLDVRQPLVDQVQRALGVRKACLLDVAVIGAPTNVSPPEGGGGDGSPVVNWGLELLVLAVAVGGGGGEDGEALSIHAVRVSSEEASWVGSSVSVKVCVCEAGGSGQGESSWARSGRASWLDPCRFVSLDSRVFS